MLFLRRFLFIFLHLILFLLIIFLILSLILILIRFQRFTSPLFCCVFDVLEELCQLAFIIFL